MGTLKECGSCEEWKEQSEFYRNSGASDGLYSECKRCNLERKRVWRENNPQKVLEQREKEREQNLEREKLRYQKKRDSIRKQQQLYYQDHKWEIAERKKEYHQENRDIILQKKQAYREENPGIIQKWWREHVDKRKEYFARRRARLTEVGGDFTELEWKALCEHSGNRCLNCGKNANLTADHVIPISRGGSNSIDNIQPLCQSCNSKKGQTAIDFRFSK